MASLNQETHPTAATSTLMSTSVGDPFLLSSYSLPHKLASHTGSTYFKRCSLYATHQNGLPVSTEGHIVAAAQGDGLHILDVSVTLDRPFPSSPCYYLLFHNSASQANRLRTFIVFRSSLQPFAQSTDGPSTVSLRLCIRWYLTLWDLPRCSPVLLSLVFRKPTSGQYAAPTPCWSPCKESLLKNVAAPFASGQMWFNPMAHLMWNINKPRP